MKFLLSGSDPLPTRSHSNRSGRIFIENFLLVIALAVITYENLSYRLSQCAESELAMTVQALYGETIGAVSSVRYAWANDGTILLTLDCVSAKSASPMTYRQLQVELKGLCSWQLSRKVAIGFPTEIVEVVTLYHEFERAPDQNCTLMLISTPPDEYFQFQAA